MKPIYIVCFYWQGERWQEKAVDPTKITEDESFRRHLMRVGKAPIELVCRYVNNLYCGINKWAVEPFKFICFTNSDLEVDKGIELRPFPMLTQMGVLPRLFMFSREAGLFGNQVLSLDIDVIITGSLEDIMNYDGMFCVRERWLRRERHLPDGDIMSFRAGRETEKIFWDPFVSDIEAAEASSTGRERFWITKMIGDRWDNWQDIAPNQIVSYKNHVLRDGLQDARIVSCHGHPRPHCIDTKWREENWENEQKQYA